MGRPREFDVDEALDAAIELFRVRGYEATTLTDIIAATGVQKGSLYQLWRGKHAIYLAALDRYLDLEVQALSAAREGPPVSFLEQVIDHVVSKCSGSPAAGCFFNNARVELGPIDPDVQARVAAYVDAVRRTLSNAIKRGQGTGELRRDKPAGLLAETFYTHIVGLLSRSRSDDLTQRRLRAVARAGIDVLLAPADEAAKARRAFRTRRS